MLIHDYFGYGGTEIHMAKVGILGAGSWGTALAVLLCRNGHQVTLWSHRPQEAEKLSKTRVNESKLPGVKLPEGIEVSGDLEQAVLEKDVLVMAVPSAAMRSTCRQIAQLVREGQIIVDVAKGIEKGSFSTMTDMIQQEIPGADAAVLSGPSHAEEVGRQLPTTCVIGARSEKTARYLQQIFMSPVFRVYISPDMLGIELGGALKNVIALAAGIADGLGYGDNAKAALITRGITEIARLGVKMGGRIETFSGLTGIGDLIVTCASMHSRNRRAGILIGQGYSMEEAMKQVNMVVEGVYSARAAVELGQKYQVELPIIEQVYQILFEGKDPKEAVNALMLRDQKVENPLLPW